MSQTIDSRVVEMKFDNKNFEKNVAESMKTLENLDKRLTKLENTDVHLDKVGKAADSIDLSKLDKSLDAITHRFSIMGQVGASVINNITTDAYNMVKNVGSKVWGTVFGQMKAGGKSRAQNVENAKFLLDGMGIAFTDEVDQAISAAVKDTAFGYDEAAVAMATLSGASVSMGDDMNQALKAIAGVAAMTNRSFSDIADIFGDAAANGKASADTFGRLAERGLAAKAVMQDFYGVTGPELDKLAKAGKVTFDDFSKAMSAAFGDQAKKSNETLNGVLANTRAVLSRMGQSFYQPIMANSSDVVVFFQQLKATLSGFEAPVKEIGKQLSGYVLALARYGTDFLKKIDVSKYQPVFENVKKMFDNLYYAAQNLYSNVLKPFGKIFKDALYEVFPGLNTGKSLLETISIKLNDASENFRKFTSEIGLFGDKGASVKDVLVSIFSALKTGANIVKGAISIIKVAITLIANFLKTINFTGILKGLTTNISYFIQVGYFLIAGIAEGLTGGIPVLFSAITEVGKMIIAAFCAFFGIASPSKKMRDDVGYWLIAGIAEGMKKALAAGLITGAIALVIGLILRQFKEGNESILSVASRIFDKTIDKIAGVFERFSKWISGTGAGKAVAAGFELIATAFTKLSEGLKKIDVDKFQQVVNAVKQLIVLGSFVFIATQFAIASTMFSSALFNISRAAKFYVDQFRIKYFGATLKNLAIAIGVITGSILLFAGMVKSQNGPALLQAVIVIGGIIAALIFAIKQIQGAIRSEDVDPHGLVKIEAMFMGLGGAVFLIASSIRKVGTLNWQQILTGLLGMAAVVLAMGGIVIAMQKFTEGNFQMEKSWMVILSIGVTARLIAGAIKSLALFNTFKPDAVWEATKQISLIIGILGAISILTQVFSKLKAGQLVDNITNINLPAMFLSLGVTVMLIAKAVKTISTIQPGDLDRAKVVMYQIMAWLGVMMAIGFFVAKSIGMMLIGLGTLVAGIAISVRLIGDMKEGIEQGFTSLIGILGLIILFVGAINIMNKATGGGKDNSGMKSLIYVGICIAAMGAVVRITGEMSLGQIVKGVGVVMALTFFVAVIARFLGLDSGSGGEAGGKKSFFEMLKNKSNKLGSAIKGIMVIKAIVSALIKLAITAVILSKFINDYDKLTLAITTLAGIMGVLSLLLLVAGEMTNRYTNIEKITKPIKALAGAILIIAGSLFILGAMPSPATMILSATAIAGVLVAMGLVLEKSKVFGVQGMNTKGILACALAIIAISAALTLMVGALAGAQSWKDYMPLAASVLAIGAILIAIGIAMKMADKTKISTKSAKAYLVATLSLIVVAGAVVLLAQFTDDLIDAGLAAIELGVTMIAIGYALKMAENVKWSSVAGLAVGALALVGVAYSISLIAGYDWYAILAAAGGMALCIGAIGGVLFALSKAAQSGYGALAILAVAAAIVVVAGAMLDMANAMNIAVTAFTSFLGVFTPETAQNILGFFTTIGEGLKPAAEAIMKGIKEAVDAIDKGIPAIEASCNNVIETFGNALINLAKTIEEKGVEVNNALNGMFATWRESAGEAGVDFVGGFLSTLSDSKVSRAVWIAAAALGVASIGGLREGIDAHSYSRETIAAALDFIGGFCATISDNTDAATSSASELGANAVGGLKSGVETSMKSANFGGFWSTIKSAFSQFSVGDWYKTVTNPSDIIKNLGLKTTFNVAGVTLGQEMGSGIQNGTEQVLTGGESGGLMGMLQSWFGGSFDGLLDQFDFSKVLGEGGIAELKDFLANAGGSMDALSGDNIPKLIQRLKDAGLAGDSLTAALKELGITEEQLEKLGIADALGLSEAKEGAEELKTSIQDLADEIIKGKFGNAPERWDKMFEHLVKSGKTAEEAYAAIADAQNEVNKRLGSSVVHTADEMSKKVSESVKKANKAQADANAKAKGETGKPGRDFKAEPFKSDSTVSKEDAKSAAEQQMLNNMPYENVKLAKEKQITAEREKQTVEAFKQKLANEHMYTLAEKQEALKNLKANEEIARQASLTTEKKKQLDAENARYQKVVDTYDEQQKMLKAIQDQEAATKKAEDAEKKRGDAVKASSGAVVYGTDEYYKQTGKTGMTINTMPTRKVEETKPVQAETKVELTPKFEVKKVDTTQLKKEVVTTVETELKNLQAKATITPKIDTSQAEASISNFKRKTQELKTTIPQTFSGIAADVSKNLTTIATKISQEGSKIATTTKTVFQNAVNAATTALTGSETITKFVNAGKSAGQGYANGIRAKIADVRAAGTALGNTAIKATKVATKTNSPSKIFTQLGEWNGIGYGNGMLDSMDYVANASSKMANVAMDEVYRVVNAVEGAVNSGMDIAPTITPVVDATQIQNGISSINAVTDLTKGDIASITANMTAKASYDDSQVEEMQLRMDEMRTAFNDLATVVSNQPTPVVNANVNLQGDADGVFKLVRDQNSVYTKMHGKSAFA